MKAPDGWAVILKDRKSSPTGHWFVGAYNSDHEAADIAGRLAKRGDRSTIKPFRFLKDSEIKMPVVAQEHS